MAIDLGRPLERGCFAWSERATGVACVVGEQSIQDGGRYAIAFVGTDRAPIEIATWEGHADPAALVLSPVARDAVESRLREDGYVTLAGDVTTVAPGGEVALPGTNARIAWRRETLDRVETEAGSWDVVRDSIVLRGASGERSVMTEEVQGAVAVPARVRVLPSGRHVLVAVASEWGFEGDVGRGFAAYVVPIE